MIWGKDMIGIGEKICWVLSEGKNIMGIEENVMGIGGKCDGYWGNM